MSSTLADLTQKDTLVALKAAAKAAEKKYAALYGTIVPGTLIIWQGDRPRASKGTVSRIELLEGYCLVGEQEIRLEDVVSWFN